MGAAFVGFCKAAAHLHRLLGLGDEWQMSFRSAASLIYDPDVIYDATPPQPARPSIRPTHAALAATSTAAAAKSSLTTLTFPMLYCPFMKVYLINYCIDLMMLPLFIRGAPLLIGPGRPWMNLPTQLREGRAARRRRGEAALWR